MKSMHEKKTRLDLSVKKNLLALSVLQLVRLSAKLTILLIDMINTFANILLPLLWLKSYMKENY